MNLPNLILVEEHEEDVIDDKGKIAKGGVIFDDYILVSHDNAKELVEGLRQAGMRQLLIMWAEDYRTYNAFSMTIRNLQAQGAKREVINQVVIEATMWIQAVNERMAETSA